MECFNYQCAKVVWMQKGADNGLLKKYDEMSREECNWLFSDNKFWLIYISILYELTKYDYAEKILKKYIKYFGLKDIEKYGLVSMLAYKLRYSNDKIKASARAMNILETSIQDNLLYKYTKNKSIAIVGNSPSGIGLKQGKEIDNHDIVIRFNNYSLQGYEEDYGKQTDIWMRNGGSDINRRSNVSDFGQVVLSVDYRHFELNESIVEFINENTNKGIIITGIPSESFFELYKTSRISWPTAGLIIFWYLKKYGLVKKIDLYGYSFLNKKNTEDFHYYKNNTSKQFKEIYRQVGIYHNMNGESEFIKYLLRL